MVRRGNCFSATESNRSVIMTASAESTLAKYRANTWTVPEVFWPAENVPSAVVWANGTRSSQSGSMAARSRYAAWTLPCNTAHRHAIHIVSDPQQADSKNQQAQQDFFMTTPVLVQFTTYLYRIRAASTVAASNRMVEHALRGPDESTMTRCCSPGTANSAQSPAMHTANCRQFNATVVTSNSASVPGWKPPWPIVVSSPSIGGRGW